MANPTTPPMVLSEILLKQALGQNKQVPIFDGHTEELTAFVRRVDYIMQLNPTEDLRQHNILFGAIELQTSGSAQRVAQLTEAKNWSQLRNALVTMLVPAVTPPPKPARGQRLWVRCATL
ncbi:hypothetical protein ACLKA6_008760 [Drosophila palustris]